MPPPGGKPSRQTIDRLPPRALAFLRGMGTCGEARAAAAARGYTTTIHETGWTLLDAACGRHDVPDAPPKDDPLSPNARGFAALEEFDRTTLKLLLRAMKRQAPSIAKAFEGSPGRNAGYLRVLQLLDLFEKLEKNKRNEDEAAIVLRLANELGVTTSMRRQLAKHLAASMQTPPDPAPIHAQSDPGARQAALEQLYLWLDEWSGVARLALGRRGDLLGRLGLAHRQ